MQSCFVRSVKLCFQLVPGGLSITVNRPVLLVLPPVGAGECDNGTSNESATPAMLATKSSVQPTVFRFAHPLPCIYLHKILLILY